LKPLPRAISVDESVYQHPANEVRTIPIESRKRQREARLVRPGAGGLESGFEQIVGPVSAAGGQPDRPDHGRPEPRPRTSHQETFVKAFRNLAAFDIDAAVIQLALPDRSQHRADRRDAPLASEGVA
jgi:hypothetical protein